MSANLNSHMGLMPKGVNDAQGVKKEMIVWFFIDV